MDSVHSRYLSEALSSEHTHKRVEVDGVRYIVMAIEGGRVASIDDVDTDELNEFATSFLRAHKTHGGSNFNERNITHIDSQGVHFKDGHVQKNSDVRLDDHTSEEIIEAVSSRYEINEDEDIKDEIDAVIKAVTPIQKIVEETNPASVSSIQASITALTRTDKWCDAEGRVDDVYNKLKQNMTAETVWKVMKKTLLPARPIMMPLHERVVDDRTRTHDVDDLESVDEVYFSLSTASDDEEEDFRPKQFDDEFSRSIGRMGTWGTPVPQRSSTGEFQTHGMRTFSPFSPPTSILEEEETSSHSLGHSPQTFSPKVVHKQEDETVTSSRWESAKHAASYLWPPSYFRGSETTEQTKDKQDHTTPSVTSHPLPMSQHLESVSPPMSRTMREDRKGETPRRQVVLMPEETPQPKSKMKRSGSETVVGLGSPIPSPRLQVVKDTDKKDRSASTSMPHHTTQRVAKGGTTISATVTMDRVRDEVKVKAHSNALSTEERRKGREDALAFLKAPEVGSLSEEGKHILDEALVSLPSSVKGVASRELNAVQQRLLMSSF